MIPDESGYMLFVGDKGGVSESASQSVNPTE